MLEPVDERIEFVKGMSWAPPATLALIGLYVVAFIWEVATGALQSTEAILAAGALEGSAVARGEVWRLASATFLHGGIDHLFGNAVMFYIVGIGLEHALGTRQMLWVYGAAGLGGSILSALLNNGPSVGASGAIFGVMTGLVAVLHRYRDRIMVRDRRIALVLALLAGWSLLQGAFTPYVDNWAHLGGALVGFWVAWKLEPAMLEER